MSRRYEESHPWINFTLNLKQPDPEIVLLLGEALSKAEHIAGVPLQPALATELNQIYLSKGAHATTQIEGNSLSEADVRKRVDRELDLPPSQQYLGQEIDNVVEGYNLIVNEVFDGKLLPLSVERICHFNELVLKDLPSVEDMTPGKIRTSSVLVGNHYRGAPSEDCEYLLEKLCSWLNELQSIDGVWRQPVAIVAAVMAHLYIAWIHPFEDGNGRTARLVEYQMLVQAGVPTVAAHIVADHYNQTRTEYYRQLGRTSQQPYSPEGLIKYSLQGFVDGLRRQINEIRKQQIQVAWRDYVHEAFAGRSTPARVRQQDLVLSLEPFTWTQNSDLRELTPRLAVAYAGKQAKTIHRDLNALEAMRLIVRTKHRVMPDVEAVLAFLPPVVPPPLPA